MNVLLMHGAASHSGQWKALIKSLSNTFRSITIDQFGYGQSPAWPLTRTMTLADQVQPVLEYLEHCEGPFHLVGHSHGATLAALSATHVLDRVLSLSLYEPNTFGLLRYGNHMQQAQLQNIRASFGNMSDRMRDEASQCIFARDLINFWQGEHAWQDLSDYMQSQLLSMMKPTANEVQAALYDEFSIDALNHLGSRLLLMFDPHSPPLALAVTERYRELLPDCSILKFPSFGHLGPISKPAEVNEQIRSHIERYHISKG